MYKLTEIEVIQGNRLIAEFMGLEAICIEKDKEFDDITYKVLSDTHLFFSRFRINYYDIERGFDENKPLNYFCNLINFKYHCSFNWLMPVIAKCESINPKQIREEIGHKNMYGANIALIFLAVVEFIKIYKVK